MIVKTDLLYQSKISIKKELTKNLHRLIISF